MAAETESESQRAIFGEKAGPQNAQSGSADQALLNALDAISDSLETHVGRWNAELDLIEEDLSRSTAPRRQVEAAAQ